MATLFGEFECMIKMILQQLFFGVVLVVSMCLTRTLGMLQWMCFRMMRESVSASSQVRLIEYVLYGRVFCVSSSSDMLAKSIFYVASFHDILDIECIFVMLQ